MDLALGFFLFSEELNYVLYFLYCFEYLISKHDILIILDPQELLPQPFNFASYRLHLPAAFLNESVNLLIHFCFGNVSVP